MFIDHTSDILEKLIDNPLFLPYNPVFDSFLAKKVPKPALVAASGTFLNFTNARYTFPFLV